MSLWPLGLQMDVSGGHHHPKALLRLEDLLLRVGAPALELGLLLGCCSGKVPQGVPQVPGSKTRRSVVIQ